MQSNSGGSACGLTASGKRRDGVGLVVDLVGRYPGHDAFTLAWIYAGGRVEGGQLVGQCRPLTLAEFSTALSLQKRVKDAEMLGKIVPSEVRKVLRLRDGKPIKATAYRLAGVQVSVPVVREAVKPVPATSPAASASRFADLRAMLD